MYRIRNTTDDRTKHVLHRTAPRFEVEPSLGGTRIRLGSYLDITDDHYDRVKPTLDEWVSKGMVEVRKLGSEESSSGLSDSGMDLDDNGLLRGGPTLEEWTAAGYQPENYPPRGYAEVFSPGLVAYRRSQEEATREAANRAADVIKEALTLPTVTEQILPPVPVAPEAVAPTPVVEPPPSVAAPSAPAPSASQPPGKADKNKKLR